MKLQECIDELEVVQKKLFYLEDKTLAVKFGMDYLTDAIEQLRFAINGERL